MRSALPSLVVPFLACTLASAMSPQGPDASWTSWRGPDGLAVSPGNPPTTWSEEKNIRWKVALPGGGSSSPIIWGDRVFVTSAVKTDENGTPPVIERAPDFAVHAPGFGGADGWHGDGGEDKVWEFMVLALDREDGEILWQTTVNRAVPYEKGHATNSQSSGSPVTDGEHIYAHFGSRGLYCLDLDGEIQWSKDFGIMQTHLSFGEGTSPALHGNKLIINWDHEGQSFIAAIDKRNGEELWRTEKDEITSWATPLIAPADGRMQVITSGTNLSRGYDLETGDLLWTLGGMSLNAIPSPSYVDGVAYLMSGFNGGGMQAVRLDGARGDLTESDNLLWFHTRNTSYTPSALIYGEFIYFLRLNNGSLSCLDRETGSVHYEGQRLSMRTIYSSPVGAAGRVYLTSRRGVTKVIKVGPEFEELASNQLDDAFDATAAIVGNEIFLRGAEHLYCIAEVGSK